MKRDPFARLKETSSEATVMDLIPTAQPRQRKREWERHHRGQTFYIPAPLVERAKTVRERILGLAQKYLATSDSVAEALLEYALDQMNAGEWTLQALPTATGRRKMSIRLVAGSGEVQEFPQPRPKGKRASLRLTYRLSEEVTGRIRDLATDELAVGEIVVHLLEFALASLESGKMRLQAIPDVVRQRVTGC